LQDVRQQLIESVEWPIKHADLFAQTGVKAPKGILLSGPPGCGKTMLAKAIANESQVNFISVKGPALLSKYVGDSEKAVREVFKKARQAAPCIIFFDEIDALVPSRSSQGSDAHVGERVISQFLTELDGVEELEGVVVLAATNRPDLLDPALLRPGRFDIQVEIPLPDRQQRMEILQIGLRNKPLAAGISTDALADPTEGMSGAEITAICRRAGLEAIRAFVELAPDRNITPAGETERRPIITQANLEQGLKEVRATWGT
jgi:transitional endoplasmic reticulum ATPase